MIHLNFIDNQTEEICLESVKQNGLSLRFVYNQTEEVCIEAVRQDDYALHFVKCKKFKDNYPEYFI